MKKCILYVAFVCASAWGCGPYSAVYSTVDFVGISNDHQLIIMRKAVSESFSDRTEHQTDWDIYRIGNLEYPLSTWFIKNGEIINYRGFNLVELEASGARRQVQAFDKEVAAITAANTGDDKGPDEVLNEKVLKLVTKHFKLPELPPEEKCEIDLRGTGHKTHFILKDSATANDLPLDFAQQHSFLGITKYDGKSCFRISNEKVLFLLRTSGNPSFVGSCESDDGCPGLTGTGETFKNDIFASVDVKRIEYLRQNIYGFRKLKEKKYLQAIEHFRQSLSENPDYSHANFNMACTLSLMNEPFSKGKPYLQRILNQPSLGGRYIKKIETDPDLAFWRETSEFKKWFIREKKETSFRVAISKDPVLQARNEVLLGAKAYKKKDYKKALKKFESAIELDRKNVDAQLGLAAMLALTGKPYPAFSHLEIAHQLDATVTEAAMNNDADFASIRERSEFKKILRKNPQ